LKSSKGLILPCEQNGYVLMGAAQHLDGLHFDEFLSRLRIGERDWTDADTLDALRWLQWAHGVPKFTLGHARSAVQLLGYSRRRDSLREFVETLPHWDRTPRIAMALCEAWGAPDTALIRAASHNLLVAMIARALRPGAQVDTLWTFEGPQGSYKSRALRELGGAFHAEISAAMGTTDLLRELLGLWIAEFSELDSLRGREASTVKRLLSAPSDRFVQKFALHAESHPRRAVAVATTNEATYWQDATGARRLVPIPCGEFRIVLIAASRLQWFAEARQRYAEGATWWEFPAAIGDEQEARQQVDPWEDALRACMQHGRRTGLDGHQVIQWPDGWIASAAIMREWLRLEPHQQGVVVSTRLGKIMRRIGYRPKRSGSGNERGWEPDTCVPSKGDVSAVVSDGIPL
jgi:predicted P-loop ATPase